MPAVVAALTLTDESGDEGGGLESPPSLPDITLAARSSLVAQSTQARNTGPIEWVPKTGMATPQRTPPVVCRAPRATRPTERLALLLVCFSQDDSEAPITPAMAKSLWVRTRVAVPSW